MSASFETSLVSAVSPSAVDIPSPILSSSVVDIPLPVPTIDPSVPSDTNSTVSARGIGKRACVEPNAVSYSGRDGKTVLVQIPEEMFENVQDAVKRNDVMYLRRLTMIGA